MIKKIELGPNLIAVLTHEGKMVAIGYLPSIGLNRKVTQWEEIKFPHRIIDFVTHGSIILLVTEDGAVYMNGHHGSFKISTVCINHWKKIAPSEFDFKKVVKIFESSMSIFIVTENNSLYACGSNKHGLLGIGSDQNKWQSNVTRVNLPMYDNFKILSITCSNKHTLMHVEFTNKKEIALYQALVHNLYTDITFEYSECHSDDDEMDL